MFRSSLLTKTSGVRRSFQTCYTLRPSYLFYFSSSCSLKRSTSYEARQRGAVCSFLSVLMSFSLCTYVTCFEDSTVWKDGRMVRYDLPVISLFYFICSERTYVCVILRRNFSRFGNIFKCQSQQEVKKELLF